MTSKKWIIKMFRTSPGNFTKREAYLIKYFLTRVNNIDKPPSVPTLQKALNLAANNDKWILKTFMIYNATSKRQKTLNQVVTTINGRVYGKEPILLKVQEGVAVIEPKKSRHRYPMFVDKGHKGSNNVYYVDVLKGRKWPKRKKGRKGKHSSKFDIGTIRGECKTLRQLISMFAAPLDPIDNASFRLKEIIRMLKDNMASFDEIESGKFFRRKVTTDRKNNKFIIDYWNKSKVDGHETFSHYEFSDVDFGTVVHEIFTCSYDIETGKSSKYADEKLGTFSKTGRVMKSNATDLKWVFDMYEPLAKELIKALNSLKTKKVLNVSGDDVMKLIGRVNNLTDFLQKYWNKTFVFQEGTQLGQKVIKKSEAILEILNRIKTDIKDFAGLPKSYFEKDVWAEYEKGFDFTEVDLDWDGPD